MANWLHERLERYRLPRLTGRTGAEARLGAVFLDSAELHAGADLDADVRGALEQSSALIVVCSPQAAASPRVDFEVREFRRINPGRPILAVLAAGRPNARARGIDPSLECLPADLLPTASHDALAADLRRPDADRREALLKIVAGLLRIPLDTLRSRDLQRTRRKMTAILVTVSAAAVSMAAAAGYAFYEHARAERERLYAVREADSAEKVTQFLVGVFGAADPVQARPHEATVREVLDAGARKLLGKSAVPREVRARLLRAIGMVYDSRGWYREAERLLGASVTMLDSRDQSMKIERARSEVAYAHLLANRHDPRAESYYRNAISVLDSDPRLAEEQIEARAYLGYVLWGAARYDEAKTLLRDALARLDHDCPNDSALRANLTQTLGRAVRDSGDLPEALMYFKESSELNRKVHGDSHYWYASTLYDVGSIYVLLGHYDEALATLDRAIGIFTHSLGPRHPFLAAPLRTRAQIYYERGELTAAGRDLVRALSIDEASDNATSVDAARVKADLALIYFERHAPATAYATMDQVLAIERAQLGEGAREYGQMLLRKAILLIRGGHSLEALPLIERARSIAERMDATDPDHLRTARGEIALGYCLAGENDDAIRALGQARRLTRAKVPPWTPWVEDAVDAACRSSHGPGRHAAWKAARSKVEARLGSQSPLLRLLDELPTPAT